MIREASPIRLPPCFALLAMTGKPSKHSPRFSEILKTLSFSESAEQRYKVDVVVMKFSKEMQYRSFPVGEREGEWGRCGSYIVWISNAAPLPHLLRFARNDGRGRRRVRPMSRDADRDRIEHPCFSLEEEIIEIGEAG